MNKTNRTGFINEDSIQIAVEAIGCFVVFTFLVLLIWAIISSIQKCREKVTRLNDVTFSILDIPSFFTINSHYDSLRRNTQLEGSLYFGNHSYESLAIEVEGSDSEREKTLDRAEYLRRSLQHGNHDIHYDPRKWATTNDIILNGLGVNTKNLRRSDATLDRYDDRTRISSLSSNHYEDPSDYQRMNPPLTDTTV